MVSREGTRRTLRKMGKEKRKFTTEIAEEAERFFMSDQERNNFSFFPITYLRVSAPYDPVFSPDEARLCAARIGSGSLYFLTQERIIPIESSSVIL